MKKKKKKNVFCHQFFHSLISVTKNFAIGFTATEQTISTLEKLRKILEKLLKQVARALTGFVMSYLYDNSDIFHQVLLVPRDSSGARFFSPLTKYQKYRLQIEFASQGIA